MDDKIINIAKIVHDANKSYCETIGDFSQSLWEDAQDWQKNSMINGVKYHLNNPDVTPEQSHENWMKVKIEDGWKYGPVKDPDKKEHPCLVPYNDLPKEQKVKDYLFKAIHDVLVNFI